MFYQIVLQKEHTIYISISMKEEGTKGKMLAKKKIFICLLNIY